MICYHFKERFGTQVVAVETQIWSRGHEAKLHVHDYTEFIIVWRGDGINQIGGLCYPVVPGDVQIIPPGVVHSFHANSDLWIINLAVSPENILFTEEEQRKWRCIPEFQLMFGKRSHDIGADCMIHFSNGTFPSFLDEINRLKNELSQIGPENLLLLRARLTLILGQLCRTLRKSMNISRQGKNTIHLLNVIFEQVEQNWRNDISAGKIAEKAGITANYLSEFFRKHTGMAFHRYWNIVRINHAREMLEFQKNMNITEIAEYCGFHDSSYFTRIYRKLTGETPGCFRKKKQAVRYIRKKS